MTGPSRLTDPTPTAEVEAFIADLDQLVQQVFHLGLQLHRLRYNGEHGSEVSISDVATEVSTLAERLEALRHRIAAPARARTAHDGRGHGIEFDGPAYSARRSG
ncbi:hypothetical protein [Nocardia yamanashiensis]|uniref:hypothetical protein n=1 Tax=Nocardia yamanashiensis TaxID=209247 RepID=UPI000831193D|nr:hypothetical protein [Nocardia yamanashiensis]